MTPPAGGRGEAERPDSAGLVEGDEPWGTPPRHAAPDAPDGAPPGETDVAAPDSDGGRHQAVPGPVVLPVVVPAEVRRDRRTDEDRERPGHGVVPHGGDSHRPDDDDRDAPLLVPPMPFPDERRRERRSEAGELLAEDDPAWGGPPVYDEPPPHHAAVVRDAEDDFASWDSEMLPWLDDDQPEPASWGDPPPAPPPPADVPDEPEPVTRARPHGESIDALLLKEMPIRSGGPDLTDEQLSDVLAERERAARQRRIELGLEDGEDEDEAPERRAADLLDRDDTQWSRSGGESTDGVIG